MGGSSDHDASLSLNERKSEERLEGSILDCHTVLGRFGKATGESSGQRWLLRESHVPQEKVCLPLAVSSSWEARLWEKCSNRFHSPVAGALG